MNDNNLALYEGAAVRSERAGPGLSERTERLVYLLRHDVLYARDAALQLYPFGYKVAIADDLQQLAAMMAERAPGCVLIDSPESGIVLTPADADRIRAGSNGRVPILLISSRNNFEARLAAARAGVDSYFTKPLDIPMLAERLDALTTFAAIERNRILVVCSDTDRSAYYQGILTVAGMEAMRPQRPVDILRMLDQFRPDAVLMDVDTPACTATDLIALVRQDSAFTDIPVILLSNEHGVTARQNALRSGADEFILKPVAPNDLIFSLTSRIERYCILRGLIMRDRLTNLYNHTAFKEQLLREMARARREKKPLAFAMLDLDFFKKVNDSHGHPAGDQVIRSIARLMRQRLRHGDVVGRYGGEEFGVILPGTTAAAAVDVLNEIRIEFQNIRHEGRDTDFCVTLSAGVAEYGAGMESLDAMSLIRMADAALYHGKRSGRNRVELAERQL